jgi:autotransporter-associated beta strand protein
MSLRLLAAFLLAATAVRSAPVFLGPLENPAAFNRTSFGAYIDYGINLNTQTYEVRLPSNYDPDKTYGLVSFIDWVDPGGTAYAAWQPVLDKYDLIWIGGTHIGNSTATDIRMGVSIMGAFRMTELQNIDPARIYSAGTSGGAQMAAQLLLMRQDFFKGFIGLAGVSYATNYLSSQTDKVIPGWAPPGRLDDSGTTNDSGTEYGWSDFAFSVGFLNPSYCLLPNHPFAILTNETDFRRMEITGIYRYFFLNHGNPVRLMVRPGGHAVPESSSFEEAVRFMTAPDLTIVRDRFENGNLATNTDPVNTLEAGSGFLNRSQAGASAVETDYSYNSKIQKVLRLTPGPGSNAAVVEAKNRFNWTNPDGITIDAKLRAETATGDNQRIGLHVARGDSDDTPSDNPGFHVFLNHGAKNRAVLVLANGTEVELARWDHAGTTHPMDAAAGDKMFWNAALAPEYVGKTKDFRGEDLRLLLDRNGFQITFIRPAANLETNFPGKVILACKQALITSGPNVGTMDGEEHPLVLQGRWSDLNLAAGIEGLAFRHWKLMLSNGALDSAFPAGDALVDEITLKANAEETNFTPPVISTPGVLAVNATSGLGAIVNFSVTASDDVDGAVPVTCFPPSGSGFPIGSTTVTCRAADAALNEAVSTFTVNVSANGFTPTPPSSTTNVTAATGFGFVTLNWNAVPYASSYTVSRSFSPGGPLTVVASGISATIFTETGLTNGTPVYYVIQAVNPAGPSVPSMEIAVTPVPGTAAKADNPVQLDQVSSWKSAGVPGPMDLALWDQTVTSTSTTNIGNGVSFSGIRITNPVGNVTIQPGSGGTLALGSQGIDMSATPSTLTLASDVALAANQVWHTGASSISSSGSLSGAGILSKSGSGVLSFSGNSPSFSGGIVIKEGALRYGGSTLNIPVFGTGGITLGETGGTASVTMDFSITPSTVVTNPLVVTAGSGARTIRSNMGNTAGHTLSGPLSGSGDLTFAEGVITFSGAGATTFTGNLFVTGGRLRLANGSSFHPGTVLSIASGATVDLNAQGSSWNFAGLRDIAGAGGTLANAGGARTINLKGSGNYVFSGNVQSNIKLALDLGSGSQTLAGSTNNYTGTTTVTSGTLVVNGALIGTAGAVTVANAGKLAGNGSLAAATTIQGILRPGNGIGTIQFSGPLSFSSTGRLDWELPANSLSGTDLVNAAAVTLNSGAALNLILNSPGSSVNFSDAFWQSNRSWTVLSSTSLTGTLALNPVTTDSGGRAAAPYGVFSLVHAASGVTLQWTAYSDIERWRYENFGSAANAGNAADSADPDFDTLENLLEWALHLDPKQAGPFLPVVGKTGAVLEYHYTRRKASLGGAAYQVEWSDTLGNDWSSSGVVADPPVSLSGEKESVRVTLPAGSSGKRFVRLNISR